MGILLPVFLLLNHNHFFSILIFNDSPKVGLVGSLGFGSTEDLSKARSFLHVLHG